MKKYLIFFVVDFIWIIVFLMLAMNENRLAATGLAALTRLGNFVLYAILCIVGIILFIIGIIIWLIRRQRNRYKK